MKKNVQLDTTMGKFGTSYNINAINNLALKAGVKPPTPQQLSQMSRSQINQLMSSWRKLLAMNTRTTRKTSRTFRKNAKAVASENFRQAELMHGTIRQGLVELGTLGAQGMAQQAAFSRPTAVQNAIQQNTDGGVTQVDEAVDSYTGNSSTEKGPVYAKRRRDEE